MIKLKQWTCPDCKRTFKHPNQWHSCFKGIIDDHFQGKSITIRKLFDELANALIDSIPFSITPLKTAVYLTAEYHFAAIFIRRNYLIIEFSNDIPFMDERIHRSQQVSKTLYSHFVKIKDKKEIDTQLLDWLHTAYELTGK